MKKYGFMALITSFSMLLGSCMDNNEFERLSVEQFGTLDDGREVQIYTLINNQGTRIDILDLGGIIINLNTADKDGNFDDITLGFDNPQQYITDSPYMGALVGRYANRIAKGKFTLEGEDYTLAINNGENALHGGLIGFDKQVWQSNARLEEGKVMLSLSLVSEDGQEGYPGTLTTNVMYTLDDDNQFTIDYQATTDQTTIINLTNHAYFNLDGHNAGNIKDHEIMINAAYYTPIDETLIPTGEIAPVEETPMDFQTSKPIGRDINMEHEQLQFGVGYDHNWILNKPEAGEMTLAASVYSANSGRTLKVYTDQPGLQFYTGNFLDGTYTGKENTTYQKRDAFCLETQHYPDSPNKPDFPSVVLQPSEEYKTQTIFEFGIK